MNALLTAIVCISTRPAPFAGKQALHDAAIPDCVPAACPATALTAAPLLSRLCVMQTRVELRRDMKAILNEVGITSILVTHDQEEAFDIADNVALFNR